MVAHDLLQPLSLAKGFLDLFVGDLGVLSPEQLAWLTVVQESHNRMEKLTTSVLEYQLLASAKDRERLRINLNDIVEQATVGFLGIAAEKSDSLNIVLVLSTYSLNVYGDRFHLQESLNNLVANAIEHTPAGGQIVIETELVDDGAVISVRDAGAGINADELEKLFDPFVRFSTVGNGQGVGLGLSFVKMVVERHGGRVSVESVMGEGSVFRIYLPIAEESLG